MCDLHVGDEVVDEVVQDLWEEPLQPAALPQDRDELKDCKDGALLTYDLSVTVTHIARQLEGIDYCTYVAGGWSQGHGTIMWSVDEQ